MPRYPRFALLLDGGEDPGFAQNRLFLGLGWDFGSGVLAEVGNLDQYIDRSGPDTIRHILSMNLILCSDSLRQNAAANARNGPFSFGSANTRAPRSVYS